MAGAALVNLVYELHAGESERRAHALSLVTDDHVDVLWRDHLAGRCDHMFQQRLAANLMQNLGPLRLQPRSLARGQNHHGQR